MLLVACGGDSAGEGAGAEGPKTYAVGHKRVLIVDDSRDEPITSDDPNDKRSFLAEIWYPAEGDPIPDDGGDRLIDYEPEEHVAAIKGLIETETAKFPGLADTVAQWPTSALADLPLAEGDERFPLLVHSHGNRGIRTLAYERMEDLARRGYIVIAPSHPGMAKWGAVPGKLIPYTPAGALNVEGNTADLGNIIDRVEELADGFLAGRVDTGSIGLSGFSAGGAVAANYARTDSRVKAFVGHATALTGGDPLELAVLGIEGSHDQATQRFDDTFPGLIRSATGDAWHVVVGPASHQAHTNACDWSPDDHGTGCGTELDDDGNEVTLLPFDEAHGVISAITAGFFDRYVKGDSAGTDAIDESLYDGKLTVETRP